MRNARGATSFTWRASRSRASTAGAARPTSTTLPRAAISPTTSSVTFTRSASGMSMMAPAESGGGKTSGVAAASVRARRSTNVGTRSSRCATRSGGSPARAATCSISSLSTTRHAMAAATRLATSEPPAPNWREMVISMALRCGAEGGCERVAGAALQPALVGAHALDGVNARQGAGHRASRPDLYLRHQSAPDRPAPDHRVRHIPQATVPATTRHTRPPAASAVRTPKCSAIHPACREPSGARPSTTNE